jgi:hypothetical protein
MRLHSIACSLWVREERRRVGERRERERVVCLGDGEMCDHCLASSPHVKTGSSHPHSNRRRPCPGLGKRYSTDGTLARTLIRIAYGVNARCFDVSRLGGGGRGGGGGDGEWASLLTKLREHHAPHTTQQAPHPTHTEKHRLSASTSSDAAVVEPPCRGGGSDATAARVGQRPTSAAVASPPIIDEGAHSIADNDF